MSDLFQAILGGGATGLLGSVFSGVLGYFKSKAEREHQLKLADHELKVMGLEAQTAAAHDALELEKTETQASAKVQAASYSADTFRFSKASDSRWLVALDVFRGGMRPAITTTLCLYSGILLFTTDDPALQAQLTNATVYLTITCVCWWFGVRPNRPAKGGA